ncbi:MAG: glucose-6-phosphate isomerase [Christensenellales bacterium]
MLRFDFCNMMSAIVKEKGFSPKELEESRERAERALDSLKRKSPGFTRLSRGQERVCAAINEKAARIRERFENFVVLGIGGSALGPIAVERALDTGQSGMRLFVEDNVDPERLSRVFGSLDLKKTMFNVITKSGKTSETMAQLMYVANALDKAGLPLAEHITATTDESGGDLIRIVQKEGLEYFIIPADVGGRFSELTPVGLLPAAVCGHDINAMLKGADYMDKLCTRGENNPAALYALLHVLGMERGINISVMLPYADSLKYMSDWYAQLWAESLGKRYDTDGKEVFAGQTPVKALGVTDQHSQIQLYTEGPYDKIVTFLKVDKFREDLTIPSAFKYIEDISFLGGKTFGQLLEAERKATEYALCKAKRPNLTISLSGVDEFSVGALLYFFEMATALAGEMLGINTYDQPGVEEGKLAAFALMGKAGFENKKAELDAAPQKDRSLIIE